MGIGFVFSDSQQLIIKKLNEALIRKLASSFSDPRNIQNIRNLVSQFIIRAIQQSSTWKSIISGGPHGINAELGIPKSEIESRLNSILETWAKEIEVEPQTIERKARTFEFSYKFWAIKADWANVLANPNATYANITNRSKRGQAPDKIPWLSWLLVAGDQLEIEDYHIQFGNYQNTSRSRSGLAIMIPKASWKMPEEFAPYNTDNNFVTKQLELLAKDKQFRKQLSNTFMNIVRIDKNMLDSLENLEL